MTALPKGHSLNVLYFAWVKEKIGTGHEILSPPQSVITVSDLIDWLVDQSPAHAQAFANRAAIKSAVDQVHVDHSAKVNAAREIAFFPPVTGG